MPLKAFATAHDALKAAFSAIDDARSERSHAEDEIVGVDKQLDLAIHALANALVGADIGTRKNPFVSFSKHPPGQIVKLGYAHKVKAARAVVKKLKPKKLPAAVSAATKTLGVRADAVAKALGAISEPGVVLGKAQGSLGRVATSWQSAFKRLKTLAAAAWIDEPETFDSVFARAEAVQAPKGAKKKRKKAAPTDAAPKTLGLSKKARPKRAVAAETVGAGAKPAVDAEALAEGATKPTPE